MGLLPLSSGAEPRTYELQCDGSSYFPRGVTATLTDRATLQVFKAWCEAAGTPTLTIEMFHEVDQRVFENDRIPSTSSFRGSGETQGYTKDIPGLVGSTTAGWTVPSEIRIGSNHPWLGGPWPGTVFDWYIGYQYDAFRGRYVWNWYNESKNIGLVIMDGNLKDWCANTGSFSESDCYYAQSETGQLEFGVTKKVRPKGTCPAHHNYTFLNVRTGETAAYFKHGGSCYTVRTISTTKIVPGSVYREFREPSARGYPCHKPGWAQNGYC